MWGDKTEEKGSDVNIAYHLLLDGFHRRYEVAVVISNDSDLRSPVKMVRDDLNLPVGILNPHQTNTSQLVASATFVKRIRQAHIAISQFPETLTDSKGTITKPSDSSSQTGALPGPGPPSLFRHDKEWLRSARP